MNINELNLFSDFEKYKDLIELKIDGARWLFASDGYRAVGMMTNETNSNVTTIGSNILSKHLFSRKYTKIDTQKFMSWLFSTQYCKTCKGNKKIVCSKCDGERSCNCTICDASGLIRKQCQECCGTSEISSKCDCCDYDGYVKRDCAACDGVGTIEEGCDCTDAFEIDEDQNSTCIKCDGAGNIEIKCENCENGKITKECDRCECGYIHEDCEECEDGYIEEECSDCYDGRYECDECDEYVLIDCDSCQEYVRVFGTALNFKFLKDLSMDFFQEISVGNRYDAVIFKGDGVMAIIMPFSSQADFREYKET